MSKWQKQALFLIQNRTFFFLLLIFFSWAFSVCFLNSLYSWNLVYLTSSYSSSLFPSLARSVTLPRPPPSPRAPPSLTPPYCSASLATATEPEQSDCVRESSVRRSASAERLRQWEERRHGAIEMEESFDAEGSFDDASCLSPQSPGSTSPARRQNKEQEIKETKITVSIDNTDKALIYTVAAV